MRLAGSWRLAVSVFAWLVIGLTPVAAQENPFDINGSPRKHGGQSFLGIDQIDPLSGNLVYVATDLVLPGNAGLDLHVTRYYNSKVHKDFANNDLSFEEKSWVGIGWRLHFGRVINPDSQVDGETLIEMPDGSRHPLYRTTAYPDGWMTPDFMLYDKTARRLRLPNGMVYTFNHLAAPNGSLGAVRYVTEIRDPHNNTLTFSYFAAPGPTDGVQQIQQDLGAGEVRTVTFTYEPTRNLLASMTYGGRTWTYEQFASSVPNHYHLRYVSLPRLPGAAVRRFTYYYDGPYAGELNRALTPDGGEIGYTYQTQTRSAGGSTFAARVVTGRQTLEYQTMTSGAWTFSYDLGVNLDWTFVTTPSGATYQYRYNGVGNSGPYNAWRSGTLAESRVVWQNRILERELLTYQASEALVNVPVGEAPWTDAALYRPLLTKREVFRDSGQAYEAGWTTFYEYRSGLGNYNDYGNPDRVYNWQYADAARDQRRTFVPPSTFTPHILGRVSSWETFYNANSGGGSQWGSSTYDPATGFTTAVSADGVGTSFAATARGNVLRVTDALQHPTTFDYQWGVPRTVQTATTRLTRTIREDGQVASETLGDPAQGSTLMTSFAYDAIGRPYTVTPPQPPAGSRDTTTFSYDNTSYLWVQSSQGVAPNATWQKSYVDSFGRVYLTENHLGQKQRTTFDAEGRVVYQSSPYTGATPPARGVWITYDGLGRPVTVVSGSNNPADADYSLTQYAYEGSDTIVTDADQRATRYHYVYFSGPGDGRLMWVRDAAGKVTRYDYRLTSTLTKVQGPGDPSDPNDPRYTTVSGPVRTWAYDATTNRLSTETHPEAGTTRYSVYNSLGQPTEVRRLRPGQSDEVTQLTYDTENRLTRRETAGTGYFATAAYDRFGRTWQTTNQDVTTTYQFDTAGRMVSRTDRIAGRDYVTSLEYDTADRLQTLVYPSPSARRVGYAYTAGRLTGITNNGNAFASSFSYHAETGALESFATGAVTQRVQVDAQFRPTRLWTTGLQQGNDLDLTLNYTRAGDISGVTDTRSPTAQSYQYDVLHRLTQAVGPWGTLAFEYDATGNRTHETRNGVTTLYSYDAGTNRLLSAGPPQEAFTYDAFGRQVGDGRATYTYTPSDAVATATGTGVNATFSYDSDNLRVRSMVNGAERYSIRGPGGQVLTEYENRCGTLVWQRDLVYGAGRLLGAVKNGSPAPAVAFALASASVSETAPGGRHEAGIQLSTLTPLPCAVSVSYQTSNGTALAGEDYSAVQGTVTFPPGSVNGATQVVAIPMPDDAVYEGAETFFVTVSSPTGGAVLGPVSSQQVTIADSEAYPVLAINDVTTSEGAGTATFTVTVTPVSAQPFTVTFATANETATAGQDYTARGNVLAIPVRTASMPIAISLLEDALPESAETFTLTLSAPVNATLGQAVGRATIVDNDRVPIDLSLGGQFLADLHTGPTIDDFVLIANPYGAPITARLTWLRPDGTGVRRDLALAARQRVTLPASTEPGVAGQGAMSLAVQSITPGLPGIDVEHSQYWANWHAGRATEGVAPASTWYLAEGATTAFDEWITVFNPADTPVTVQFDFFGTGGLLQTRSVAIPQGPGRVTVAVRPWIGSVDHGTRPYLSQSSRSRCPR